MALFNNVTRNYQHLPVGKPVIPAPTQNRAILRVIEAAQQLFPDRSAAIARRYQRNSNTAQIKPSDKVVEGPPPGDSAGYGTQLERAWQTRTRSDQIFPIVRPASSTAPFPYPNLTDFGPAQSPTGRDFPRQGVSPISARPVYAPIPSPYVATVRSKQDKKRRNLVPISGGQSAGLDFGPAPDRIPYMRRLTGISLMAGPAQFSTQQFYDNLSGVDGPSGCIIIAPPAWNNKTRGYRSASGVLGRVQGGGRQRIPAVYVPQQVS